MPCFKTSKSILPISSTTCTIPFIAKENTRIATADPASALENFTNAPILSRPFMGMADIATNAPIRTTNSFITVLVLSLRVSVGSFASLVTDDVNTLTTRARAPRVTTVLPMSISEPLDILPTTCNRANAPTNAVIITTVAVTPVDSLSGSIDASFLTVPESRDNAAPIPIINIASFPPSRFLKSNLFITPIVITIAPRPAPIDARPFTKSSVGTKDKATKDTASIPTDIATFLRDSNLACLENSPRAFPIVSKKFFIESTSSPGVARASFAAFINPASRLKITIALPIPATPNISNKLTFLTLSLACPNNSPIPAPAPAIPFPTSFTTSHKDFKKSFTFSMAFPMVSNTLDAFVIAPSLSKSLKGLDNLGISIFRILSINPEMSGNCMLPSAVPI